MDRWDGVEQLEGVASAYAATRDGIDTMLRDRGLRKTSPQLTSESLFRGAYASAVLAGTGSAIEDLQDGTGDETAQAALRVSIELLGLVPVFTRSPAQALARLHVIASSPSVPDEERGRPRDSAAAVRLRDSLTLLDAGRPALITAALLHAEIVCGEPFVSANGIVGRAAERLVLVSSGVDMKSLVVPEAGHLALRAAYESNLRGYACGSQSGLQAWLLYGAEAFAAGAEASPVRG